jgi:Antirepressor regulating drug resistance, predicted signal transduction N-terminal membrane component
MGMVKYSNNIFVEKYTPFSIYAVYIALLWVGIFTIGISVLRKNSFFIKHCSIQTLFVLFITCITRILLPIEMPYTKALNFDKILPEIAGFFCMPLIQFRYLTITPGLIIIFIWILPATFIIYRHIKEYLHFKHALDIMPATEDQHLYNIFEKADIHNNIPDIKIIVHAYVNSPAIIGIFHPVIILPDISFNDNELLSIFMHEISHYKYKHQFIKLIMEFICAIFWWNPLFKKLSSELSHAMELQSDKAVCLNLNHKQKKEYLQAIAKVAGNTKNKNLTPPCLCSILEKDDGKNLLQRFRMITENNYHTRKKLDIIIIPLIISLFLLSYLFIFQPFSEPTLNDIENGEIDLSTDTTDNEECFIIKSDNEYNLYNSSGELLGGVIPGNLHYLDGIKIYENKEEANKERNLK